MQEEEKNAQIIDLSGALKSYKKTSFQDNDSNRYYSAPNSKFVYWTIKFSGGLIKNKKQANVFLLVFVVAMIAFSLFLIFSGNSQTAYPLPVDFNT